MVEKIRIREKTENWMRWEIYNIANDAELYDQFRIIILEGPEKLPLGEWTWQSNNPAPNTWFEKADLKPNTLYEAHGYATWAGTEYGCGIVRGYTESSVGYRHRSMWYDEQNILANPYAEGGVTGWAQSGVSAQDGGIRRSAETVAMKHFRMNPTAYMTQTFNNTDFTDSRWHIKSLLLQMFYKFDSVQSVLDMGVKSYVEIRCKYQPLIPEAASESISNHKTRITNIDATAITWEIFNLQYPANEYDGFRILVVNEDTGLYVAEETWTEVLTGNETSIEITGLEESTRYTGYSFGTWNGVEYPAGSATGTTGGADEGIGASVPEEDIIILPLNSRFSDYQVTEEGWVKLDQVVQIQDDKELVKVTFTVRTVGITGYLRVDGFNLTEGFHRDLEDANKQGALEQTGVGTNKYVAFDQWGINPDFIKRFPNKVVGSGFEWYDGTTGRPYFWDTNGRSTDASNWEGTVALRLNPGQTAKQGSLFPVHKGTLAGADPAWWDNHQTRVSFKHKGGAVRVKVEPYPNQPWSWDGSENPTWYRPQSGSSGEFSYARCANGEVICVYGGGTHGTQAFCESVEVFMTQNDCLFDHTVILDGSSNLRLVVFNYKDDLYLVYHIGQSDSQEVKILKSSSGNGRDEYNVPDWEYYSTVRESAVTYGRVLRNYKTFIAPLVLPSGRIVIGYTSAGVMSGYLLAGTTFATSDDDMLTWTDRQRWSTHWYDLFFGRTMAYYGGNIYIDYAHTYGSGGGPLLRSSNDGESFSSMGYAVGHMYSSAFYVYNGYLWAISGRMYYSTTTIKRTNNPFDSASWETVWSSTNNWSGAFAVYFKEEQERVWSLSHHILGKRVINEEPYLLTDNSEQGMKNKYGQEVGIIKEGQELDYPYIENWAYMEPPTPEDPNVPYLITGYHTFSFKPIAGRGRVRICFENIDGSNPCYIDAVQIEPDFTGKWPSLYTQGPRSTAPGDIIGMPGIGAPEWDETEGSADQAPEAHANTHSIGGVDRVYPNSIGAETPAGAQSKADQALSDANDYTDQEIAALDDEYLNKANTVPYTPTEDYHPVTKLYVDENEFINLQDTPNSYAGHAGKIVSVNEDGNALLFSEHAGLNISVRSFDIMSRGGIGGEAPTIDIVNTVHGWKMDIGEAFYIAGEID